MDSNIKTYLDWERSDLDLDVFLDEPCQIDEELSNYIMEVVPATYISDFASQGGDPINSFEYDNEKVYTYMTVSEVNGKYFYLGILPEFSKQSQ